jgi:hypothetical protein
MNLLEVTLLNRNLLERKGSLLTQHCEQVLLYCGSYEVLNSERLGELYSSVRVFCCFGRPFHLAFFLDEMMRQRYTCFVSFPFFKSAITHPSVVARCVFRDCGVVHGPGRLSR